MYLVGRKFHLLRLFFLLCDPASFAVSTQESVKGFRPTRYITFFQPASLFEKLCARNTWKVVYIYIYHCI